MGRFRLTRPRIAGLMLATGIPTTLYAVRELAGLPWMFLVAGVALIVGGFVMNVDGGS